MNGLLFWGHWKASAGLEVFDMRYIDEMGMKRTMETAFLLVNLIGFIIYYSCPAAPPWYVSTHGFVFDPHTAGSTAGLARFDALVHVPVFRSIYTQSSNIFAAMPSLHSAYPVIVFYYGVTNKLRVMSFVFAGVMGGIWFSAVYTGSVS